MFCATHTLVSLSNSYQHYDYICMWGLEEMAKLLILTIAQGSRVRLLKGVQDPIILPPMSTSRVSFLFSHSSSSKHPRIRTNSATYPHHPKSPFFFSWLFFSLYFDIIWDNGIPRDLLGIFTPKLQDFEPFRSLWQWQISR